MRKRGSISDVGEPDIEDAPAIATRTPITGNGCGTQQQRGFSLVEVLIVLTLMLFICSTAVSVWSDGLRRARETAALAYMKTWPAAIEVFYQNFNRYPDSLSDLVDGGLLGQIDKGKVPYDFTLAKKLAAARAASSELASSGKAGKSSFVTEWIVAISRWAEQPANAASGAAAVSKGHAGGCNPSNPGQGVGGPCAGSGAGSEVESSSVSGGADPDQQAGGWEGWGRPTSGKGKYFYIDETGFIRYSLDSDAGPASPRL